MSALTITLLQLNPRVGDIVGNAEKIAAAYRNHLDSDLIITSEMALSGYPADDLLLERGFLEAVMAQLRELATLTHCHEEQQTRPALLIGAPMLRQGISAEDALHGVKAGNAAVLLEAGTIAAAHHKYHLPNYGVFDEKRVFVQGPSPVPVPFRGHLLGVLVCEDMWVADTVASLKKQGAEILIALNASPFEGDKYTVRIEQARARTEETHLPLLYVNQFGGQDELVFDGGSFVMGADGGMVHQMPMFAEATATGTWNCADNTCTFDAPHDAGSATQTSTPTRLSHIWQALVTGLRDYVNKNGFKGVILGLSGGIDSALVAAIAVDALGARRVRGIMMHSPWTAKESVEDAEGVAALLGIAYHNTGISDSMEIIGAALENLPGSPGTNDTTDENIQSRLRGLLLMALSNRSGDMVLATGNKSEMAVGYATLYGDMCGGFAVLKDIYKTQVFALARWRNAQHDGPVMPERVITKAPSAELKPDQRDEDTLPPYEVLDGLLHGYIEQYLDVATAAQRSGNSLEMARDVRRLLDGAEYKRRQAPPGVKITPCAFGRERRYPIINHWRGE